MEEWFHRLGVDLLETLSTLAGLFDSFDIKGSSTPALFESLRKEIVERFGEHGLYAAYISCVSIALFALVRILKLTFTILRVVALPSLALAFVGSVFLPMSFLYLLPVTVSISSVWLLFRS